MNYIPISTKSSENHELLSCIFELNYPLQSWIMTSEIYFRSELSDIFGNSFKQKPH